jgi:hypothetical protein
MSASSGDWMWAETLAFGLGFNLTHGRFLCRESQVAKIGEKVPNLGGIERISGRKEPGASAQNRPN